MLIFKDIQPPKLRVLASIIYFQKETTAELSTLLHESKNDLPIVIIRHLGSTCIIIWMVIDKLLQHEIYKFAAETKK